MAGSTAHMGFNRIDDTDLVEVERDINYNFKRADTYIKPLIEYQLTDVSSIANSDIPKDVGFKYYKWFTNSIWSVRVAGSNVIYQDINSQVSTWTTQFGTFEPGYGSLDLISNRIAVSVFNGWVTWRGKLALNAGGSVLPAYSVINFLTVNADLLPTRARYFTVGGGKATGEQQVGRIFIPNVGSADHRMEFTKYGGAPATVADRYLSLNTIRYPLDDTV